jgi:hypothetical protein
MKYWWVNLNKTYKLEVPGGFMWSPVKKSNGASNPFWDNMTRVSPGDVVFAYAEQKIKAIGIAQRNAYSSPKPTSFEATVNNWEQIGWLVEVEFQELESPIVPKEHLSRIKHFLKDKSAPIDENGRGKERYLVELQFELAAALIEISNTPLPELTENLAPQWDENSEYEIKMEIEARHLEGDPEKIQLTKSRRGQGIFKANVRLVENRCRVTGLRDIKHLRASHIKPWAASSKEEKLDGYNGLLLSPHIDHLFDNGFISFKNDGELLVAKGLSSEVIKDWSLSKDQNVGEFRKPQQNYLEYHRDVIYQKKNLVNP